MESHHSTSKELASSEWLTQRGNCKPHPLPHVAATLVEAKAACALDSACVAVYEPAAAGRRNTRPASPQFVLRREDPLREQSGDVFPLALPLHSCHWSEGGITHLKPAAVRGSQSQPQVCMLTMADTWARAKFSAPLRSQHCYARRHNVTYIVEGIARDRAHPTWQKLSVVNICQEAQTPT